MDEENIPKIDGKLENILLKMSKKEQEVIRKQLSIPDNSIVPTHEHRFSGRKFRMGIISDTHIGSKYFDEQLMEKAFKYFERQKVDAIYHAGDILEGMSGRPGHIYEMDAIGLSAQLEKASQILSSTDLPIYGITGNHDHWFMQKADIGADVGQMLEQRVKNFTHIGLEEANIILPQGIKMKIVHPGKGTAYAISYQGQKLIESFDDDEKPDISISGHYHKSLHMYLRGVHHFEAGCIQGQSGWMRSKNIPAHMGAWCIDAYHNKKGLDRLVSTFITKD